MEPTLIQILLCVLFFLIQFSFTFYGTRRIRKEIADLNMRMRIIETRLQERSPHMTIGLPAPANQKRKYIKKKKIPLSE